MIRLVKYKHAGRSRGQGMTEYVIVVALIAIAAASVYGYLGKTIRHQTAAVANALAGEKENADAARSQAAAAADNASTEANKALGLSTFPEGIDAK